MPPTEVGNLSFTSLAEKCQLTVQGPAPNALPTPSALCILADEHYRRCTVPEPLLVVDVQRCFINDYTRRISAIDAFALGIVPRVLSDCCASTAGLQAHLAGIAILSRNFGPHQLRPSGLGGSEIAAPESPGS